MRSMALRLRQRKGEKQFFHLRLALGGMFGMAPPPSTWRRMASLSYPLSPCRISHTGSFSNSSAPAVQSAIWPPVSMKASGRQWASVSAWILVVRLPREWPIA